MPLYERNGIWWLDVRVGGRRVRRSTGTGDKREAQRQHDALAARRWQVKQGGRTLADALLAWLDAKPRARSALGDLKQMRAQYPDRRLLDVTEASIIEVFGCKSPGTYNKIASVFRAALNVARDRGWIDAVPKIKRRAEPEHRLRFLTADEWKALRAELAPHLRAMADLSIATGLRWENVAGLTWDRVSLKRRQAWIPADSAKGRRPIIVPLPPAAVAALQRLEGERKGFVFTYRGDRISSPKTGFRAAVKRAGLGPDVTWHTLRRTWASWHAMNGTPLPVLKELGAWRSDEMVSRYAILSPSHLAQYAGNAKPVDTKIDTGKKKRA